MRITLTAEQQEKWDNFKKRAAYKRDKAVEFIADHIDIVVPILTITVPAVIGVAKSANRARAEKIEEKRRDTDWYDAVNGNHVVTKRKLTPREMNEVSQRHAEGEAVTEILYDMNLIKR